MTTSFSKPRRTGIVNMTETSTGIVIGLAYVPKPSARNMDAQAIVLQRALTLPEPTWLDRFSMWLERASVWLFSSIAVLGLLLGLTKSLWR